MIHRRQVLAAVGTIASVGGCLGDGGGPTSETTTDRASTVSATASPGGSAFRLTSTAFAAEASIPARFTCEGANRSPPLTVSNPPDAAEAYALVVDDPDAPRERPFVHWLLWNVPSAVTTLPAGVPGSETVASLDGAQQGTNSAGRIGYDGPCPPRGDGPHRYRFTLSALDRQLELSPGAERPAFDDAVSDARVARIRLTGTFERS